MALCLRYHRETGSIQGVWESNNLDLLAAQQVDNDPLYGYLLCPEPLAARTVEQEYQVRDGRLVQRAAEAQG